MHGATTHRTGRVHGLVCAGLTVMGLAVSLLPPDAQGADTSCVAINKAGQAALAQPRVHAAIEAPLDPAAAKMGMKKTLLHSIVIDKDQYSNALAANFRMTRLSTPDERLLASDLGAFMVETGCKAQGAEQRAGRQTVVFAATLDMGRGPARLTYWIDKQTGLPLRMLSDEPEMEDTAVDDALRALGQKKSSRKPVGAEQKGAHAEGKRVVSTHVYVFGDAVKAPAAGTVDSAALAQLQSLLR